MIKCYLKVLILLVVSTSLGSSLSFAQATKDDLYKWKDKDGIWHYSKIPPYINGTNDGTIEIAKETRTIIFEKPKETPPSKEKELEQERLKLKEKTLHCQMASRSVLNIALVLTKLNDKALQQKNISTSDYIKEKRFITKLEDIGSDTSLTDDCVADFNERPDIKDIYDCATENVKVENQKACLRKYIIITE